MFDKEIYIKRREKLKENFESGVIILAGNDLLPMNCESNTYHFMQDSSFLYYFGINKPGYIGIIDIDNKIEYLHGPNPTIDEIIWEGDLPSLFDIAKEAGVNNIVNEEQMDMMLLNREKHFINQYNPSMKLKLARLFRMSPYTMNDKASYKLMEAITNQRIIKNQEEILLMEEEANITKKMHLKAMKKAKKNMKAYELESIIRKEALRNGSQLSFPSIVTINGQTLHNPNYDDVLEKGKLLLIDAGSRGSHGYCADMTTIIPVGVKFSPEQKSIYDLLIEMYNNGESMLKPDISYKEIHLSVCELMVKGLIERGFMMGEAKEIVDLGAHALFMPHGLGHMLGLDVHDMENFGEELVGYGGEKKSEHFGLKSLRLGRKLQEGFCLTLEPGIYFIPQLIDKWKKEEKFLEFINYEKLEEYKTFGGMRYEGDYVITKEGAKLLGGYRPRTSKEVEEYING